MDTRRHAPVGRRRLPALAARPAGPSTLGRLGGRRGDIFSDDGVQRTTTHGFRWLVSSSLAAAVAAISVAVVVLGSGDRSETELALRQLLKPQGAAVATAIRGPVGEDKGLRWAIPKADRLQMMSGALSARFLMHDTMRQKRGARDVIVNKSFVRLVARLAPVSARDSEKVPPFNPYRLYATPGAGEGGDGQNATDDSQDISTRLVELIGGLLPAQDGQEIDANEAAAIVLRAVAQQEDPLTGAAAIRGGFQPDGANKSTPQELLADRSLRAGLDRLPPNTTALAKTTTDGDDTVEDLEARQVKVVKVARGQTMTRILLDMGGDRVQVRTMVEAAKPVLADSALVPGMEAHVTLVPSLIRANAVEPARISVFGEAQEHRLTVARNAAGEFVASATPIEDKSARADMGNEDNAAAASLYTSFYYAALSHGLPPDIINQILRLHAYETDFRRRVRGSDQVEWFFDTREDDKGLDASLGDLLLTSITTGGDTQRFYRFRTQDGIVDYYDESGNTSRKFLMRRPVRGDGMRLASGFGMRRHPILGFARPHNGVDWAGPIGTPIMAAGGGVIEDAGRKGEYGNYIRLRHANGYKTSYAHMSRFAPGISEGVRVRQGQVIGFVGNTGLSAGPHLHYEVHVNGRPVDPMSIQVPRDRKLTANQLRDFLREKNRIDDLLRRNPVSSRIVDQQAALR